MSDRTGFRQHARTPIRVGIVAIVAEVACILLVHSSHRAAAAVVSGQATGGGGGDAIVGWLVVAAEMASVLVLPPLIIAAVLGMVATLASRTLGILRMSVPRKPLHTARSCK